MLAGSKRSPAEAVTGSQSCAPACHLSATSTACCLSTAAAAATTTAAAAEPPSAGYFCTASYWYHLAWDANPTSTTHRHGWYKSAAALWCFAAAAAETAVEAAAAVTAAAAETPVAAAAAPAAASSTTAVAATPNRVSQRCPQSANRGQLSAGADIQPWNTSSSCKSGPIGCANQSCKSSWHISAWLSSTG